MQPRFISPYQAKKIAKPQSGLGAEDPINFPTDNETVYSSAGTTTFNVPAGVTRIGVKMWGGGGGGASGRSGSTSIGGDGGDGGYAEAILTVTPSESLTIQVGAGGAGRTYNITSPATAGGSGGGGNSPQPTTATESGGGGGGGYSGVVRSSTILACAGGGGGGGGCVNGATPNFDGSHGGVACGCADRLPNNWESTSGWASAGGGSNVNGGTGGASGTSAQRGADGTSGAGGVGGTGLSGRATGGGGGGGYYGGGGGFGHSNDGNFAGAGGGGGGSSYVESGAEYARIIPNLTRGTMPNNTDTAYISGRGLGGSGATGTNSGTAGADGLVVITY